MTAAELQRLIARVQPTICKTYSQDEHDGAMQERIMGRISADDFMALCVAAESAGQMIGDATADMGRAIAVEREACAKIIDDNVEGSRGARRVLFPRSEGDLAGTSYAAVIRARGEQKE